MKPYNVGPIIAPGEVNNPVMVWIIFFQQREERDKCGDVLGLGVRTRKVAQAAARVGLRELWLRLACSLRALGVKCGAL